MSTPGQMSAEARAQQRTLTWGGSKRIDLVRGDAGVMQFPPGAQTEQVVRAEANDPTTWLVQIAIQAIGFTSADTDPISLTLITNVGVGQAQVTIETPFSMATPDYAAVVDNGRIPARSLQLQLKASGGVYSAGKARSVMLSAFVSPWVGGGPPTERLDAILELLEHIRRGT